MNKEKKQALFEEVLQRQEGVYEGLPATIEKGFERTKDGYHLRVKYFIRPEDLAENCGQSALKMLTMYELFGQAFGQRIAEAWAERNEDFVSEELFGTPYSGIGGFWERVWRLLGDVPIDEKQRIDIGFLWWEAGTPREEIWHDIDRQYPIYKLQGQHGK